MAKISRYEQNQLQSELVGTPGVDTSTAQIFNVAAQGFGDVATQMRYAAAQKQREVAAATKALATADRQARIGSIALSKAATWNNVDNELRAKHQWDTSGGLDALQERISQDLTQTVQGVSDPLERAELTKALQVQQAAQIKSFSDWQTGRIVPNATANAKAMADSQIQLMSAPPADPTDPNQWWGKEALQPMIDTFNRNSSATYQTVAGPAATAEQRKVLAEGFKQRLAAYNLTMPEVMSKQGKEYTSDMLGAAVEAVRKTGLVDPEDLNKFANEQEHIRNEEVQAAAAQQRLDAAAQRSEARLWVAKELPGGQTDKVTPTQLQTLQKDPRWSALPTSEQAAIIKGSARGSDPDTIATKEATALSRSRTVERAKALQEADARDAELMKGAVAAAQSAAKRQVRIDQLQGYMAQAKTGKDKQAIAVLLENELDKYTTDVRTAISAGSQMQPGSAYRKSLKSSTDVLTIDADRLRTSLKLNKNPKAVEEKRLYDLAMSRIKPISPYTAKGQEQRNLLFNHFVSQEAALVYNNAADKNAIVNNAKRKTKTGALMGQADYFRQVIQQRAMKRTEEAMRRISGG